MERPGYQLINRGLWLALAVVSSVNAAPDMELRAISSRPDAVSGGDVLVEVRVPGDTPWAAQLNGKEVSASFRLAKNSGKFMALLSPLEEGKNILELRVGDVVKDSLTLINHPVTGPMFSGAHQAPFFCETEANGLGPELDVDCSAKTLVQYYYKSTKGLTPAETKSIADTLAPGLAVGFKPFDPQAAVPGDVAHLVAGDGRTVPYIVRREIGTINRAIYNIQFLHQPGAPLPNPWSGPSPGWNGRLAYYISGGCGPGFHQGSLLSTGYKEEALLRRGYAVAAATLDSFGVQCDPVIAAETLSMVKEHFIKEHGVPTHTIGWGPSGGAMALFLIAQNYPGLLDGIVQTVSFPDWETTAQSITDCILLDGALKQSKLPWTEQQKAAVSGFVTFETCRHWAAAPILDAQHWCAMVNPQRNVIAADRIYDRKSRPHGVRCDVYEASATVLGIDPSTGFARRPLDNVGVQYGLVAFNEGVIDAEQFVELNESVGGFDVEGHVVAERSVGDPQALRSAYQGGLVMTGGGGLGQIPIIDWRAYADSGGGTHDRFRSLVARLRLIAGQGGADNQVIVVGAEGELDPEELVPQMDRWLDRIDADVGQGVRAVKIARNKPPGLFDGCRAPDGKQVAAVQAFGAENECNQWYPPHTDPRIAAGGPLTDDVLKCQLKLLSAAQYSHVLTGDQMRRLKAVFPQGICDFSKSSVGR